MAAGVPWLLATFADVIVAGHAHKPKRPRIVTKTDKVFATIQLSAVVRCLRCRRCLQFDPSTCLSLGLKPTRKSLTIVDLIDTPGWRLQGIRVFAFGFL